MNVKRLCAALAACAALSAVLASSASAAMSAEGQWYLGSSAPGTLLSGTKLLSCSASPITLNGTVGSTPVKLEGSVECFGDVIENQSSHGLIQGRMTFSSVRVLEPTGCTLSGVVTTEPLKDELYMYSGSSTGFVKFEPSSAGGNIAVFPIEGTCAARGSRVLKGAVFAELNSPTSTPSVFQTMHFSPAVDVTAGTELKFSGNPAGLSGTLTASIGQSFMEH
jgi:hypothetical protein